MSLKFYVHRRREGYTWFLKSRGKLIAISATYFTERRTAVRAIKTLKNTITEAEIQEPPKGDRPIWAGQSGPPRS